MIKGILDMAEFYIKVNDGVRRLFYRCKSFQVISVGVPQVLSAMKQNPDLVLANLDPSDLFDESSKY